MPLYEYVCAKCGVKTELIQKFSDAPLDKCPECGGAVTRPISQTNFVLKGGGWYKDLYSSTPTKSGSSSESSGGSASTPTPSGSGEKKSETKSESKSDTKSSGASDSAPAPKKTCGSGCGCK